MPRPQVNIVKREQIARAMNNDQAVIRSYEELLKLLNPPYGRMYATNVTVTVTVLATNTAYEIQSGFTDGELNKVTFPDVYYLMVDEPGMYKLDWSMSIDTSNVADQVEGGYMVDGVAQETSTSHTTVSAVNGASDISDSDIVELAAGQKLSLYVRNHTAARNIEMQHGGLTIHRIKS